MAAACRRCGCAAALPSAAVARRRPLRRKVSSYGDRSGRVVYIAAEGARTERDYVSLLNREYGERPGKGPFRLHFCRPPHSNGLRPSEVVHEVLRHGTPGDEMWALFDRDAADSRDTDIRTAMRAATRHGVQVALSHPSFELWLLLHFQQFTSQENGRDAAVIDRLRRQREAKGFEDYDKASGERGKGLTGQRAVSLLGREPTAVRNARKLIDRCPHGSCTATRHRAAAPRTTMATHRRATRCGAIHPPMSGGCS